MKPKTKTLTATVKETIDFVYDYLSPHQDGIVMNAKSLGNVQREVVTVLVGRGIITKTAVQAKGRRGVEWVYRWVATMPPTNVLYGSVTDQIRKERRDAKKRGKKSTSLIKASPAEALEELASRPVSEEFVREEETATEGHIDIKNIVSILPDEVLWDELKRRGYEIKGDEIVRTITKVLR